MKTITKTVHLVAYHFAFMEEGGVHYGISEIKQEIGPNVLGSWEHEVTLPLPEEFNVHAAQVAALEAEKQKAIADYQAAVVSINDRLSKLLALTNEATP